jgi:dimethylargininase
MAFFRPALRAIYGHSLLRYKHHNRNGYYTVAICRDIPQSFVNALSKDGDDSPATSISMDKARKQHQNYVQVLQKQIPSVICLPALEDFPDCVFVEDTVVAIGSTACLTRLGARSRQQGEGKAIQMMLETVGIRNIIDMSRVSCDAVCDGGDVLFTGRHLFVGLSKRTNMQGVDVLKIAFRELDVPIIPISLPCGSEQVLHLKSAVTHLDEETLLAPVGVLGDEILDAMQAIQRGYNVIRLPNTLACNAVVANGHVIAQDTACLVSKERIMKAAQQRNLGLTFVDTSELAKKDGALTCCSVLFSC